MSQDQDTQATAQPASAITANHDARFDVKEFTFGFRKTKDEDTGVETKRPNIELKLPILSVEGIIEVLQNGGKELELLQQAVYNVYADYAKSLINDDASLTTENFPVQAVTWNAIANQPESERKGRGIAKEVWEDFGKSYLDIMPGLTGKTLDQVKRQAAILLQKLNPLKNHEKKEEILPKFKEALAMYINNAPDAEQFVGCVEFLNKKIDDILASDKESNLVENLGF